MNAALSIYLSAIIILLSGLLGCKKEYSCEGCIPQGQGGNPLQQNRPPVAQAGADQIITLPTNAVTLNGNGSTDPDNNITNYSWTKISGPSSFSIVNPAAIQTRVTSLVDGTYFFELKVTDAGNLFDKDTIAITVQATPACDNNNRQQVNAQLIPTGILSKARGEISVASAGSKIVFAGGFEAYQSGSRESAVVDIYDIGSQSWTTTNLSIPRVGSTAVTGGNKIFFAGGGYAYSNYYSKVDIYDVLTNTWSTTALSEPKTGIAAAVVGNKVLFAGGYKISGDDFPTNKINTVEVYDLSANSWSTPFALSEPRGFISAITVNNKAYFAGGVYENSSTAIDVYDNVTNSWSVSSLNFIDGRLTGVPLSNKIYWVKQESCKVEIKNINDLSGSLDYLSRSGNWHSVVIKNGKVVVINHNSDRFDIYDPLTNTWSVGILPQPVPNHAAVISVNNIIYIAGGLVDCVPMPSNCSPVYSNQVYKLEF